MSFISRLALASLLLTYSVFPVYAENTQYEEIEWVQLIPKSDLEILLNPPENFANIVDGSDQDSLDRIDEIGESDPMVKRFSEALKSQRVVSDYDGKPIRIPGFVVPLESNEEREVTSFFIVPYFGACLHLPPPPPNQIIYGTWNEGLEVDQLSIPMWFEGTININTIENELGTSAYELKVADIRAYD